MRRWVIAATSIAALAAAVFFFFRSPDMDDPSQLPPRPLQIVLGQTVRDFILANGLPIETGRTTTPDANNYAVAVDVIADTGPIVFGDHWIALSVRAGRQAFALPPGRTLFIDQEAGRIKSFSFTPYDKAHPLGETNRLVKQMLDGFLAGGWKPKVANSLTFALTDDEPDLARRGEKIYAQLLDAEGDLLNVTVANLASQPSQPAYLITPPPERPAHVPPVYVVRVGLYWARRNEMSYGDLIYPRRIFVNGDKDRILRLRAWVDDPDWTPEQHGMVDDGGTGEGRRWRVSGH